MWREWKQGGYFVQSAVFQSAIREGHAKGRAEGERKAYMDMVREGMISVSDAAKKLQMSEEEFHKIAFESIK